MNIIRLLTILTPGLGLILAAGLFALIVWAAPEYPALYPSTTTASITYDELSGAATVTSRNFAVFTSQSSPLAETYGWRDYDNHSDLDILLTGRENRAAWRSPIPTPVCPTCGKCKTWPPAKAAILNRVVNGPTLWLASSVALSALVEENEEEEEGKRPSMD